MTKGLEMALPGGLSFVIHEGSRRKEARMRWWLPTGSTWRAAAIVPEDTRGKLPDDEPVPEAELSAGNFVAV